MGEMAEYHDLSTVADDACPAHGENFERRTVGTVISNPDRLPGTWVTAERVVIRIADMKNSHLRNTIELLRRNALKKVSSDMQHEMRNPETATTQTRFADFDLLHDLDARSEIAWGPVYVELLDEALFRSDDGDLEKWLAL